jgi:hypothetical protein
VSAEGSGKWILFAAVQVTMASAAAASLTLLFDIAPEVGEARPR